MHRAKEREQLVKEFCQADLVIMPSRTEGFGLAVWSTCWWDEIHYLYLDTYVSGDCMCVFMDTCQKKEALYCKS